MKHVIRHLIYLPEERQDRKLIAEDSWQAVFDSVRMLLWIEELWCGADVSPLSRDMYCLSWREYQDFNSKCSASHSAFTTHWLAMRSDMFLETARKSDLLTCST